MKNIEQRKQTILSFGHRAPQTEFLAHGLDSLTP